MKLSYTFLTANFKYSPSKMANLPLPIQTQLSEKPKIFCCIFIAFLESTLNFEHFEKRKRPSVSISEVKTRLLKCIKDLATENLSVVNVLSSTVIR